MIRNSVNLVSTSSVPEHLKQSKHFKDIWTEKEPLSNLDTSVLKELSERRKKKKKSKIKNISEAEDITNPKSVVTSHDLKKKHKKDKDQLVHNLEEQVFASETSSEPLPFNSQENLNFYPCRIVTNFQKENALGAQPFKKKHKKRKFEDCEGGLDNVNLAVDKTLSLVPQKKKKHKSKKRESSDTIQDIQEADTSLLSPESSQTPKKKHKHRRKNHEGNDGDCSLDASSNIALDAANQNTNCDESSVMTKAKKLRKSQGKHSDNDSEMNSPKKKSAVKTDRQEKTSEVLPTSSKQKSKKSVTDKSTMPKQESNSSDDFEVDKHPAKASPGVMSKPKTSVTPNERTLTKDKNKKTPSKGTAFNNDSKLSEGIDKTDDGDFPEMEEDTERTQLLVEWLETIADDMYEESPDFEPPVLHTRYPLLKGLLPQEKQDIADNKIPFRYRTPWTKKEDEILRRNLTKFMEEFKIPKAQFILGINRNQIMDSKQMRIVTKYLRLKKFATRLAEELNDRTLHSVNTRARTIFHPMKKKRKAMNEEELTLLFRLQAKKGNSWTTLSEIMKRTSSNLRDAARYHLNKKDSGKWTQVENEKLLNAVKNKMKLSADGQFKSISWKKIAKKVGTRTSTQCRIHWLDSLCWQFNHENVEKPRWTKDDTIKLINYLYNSDATAEVEVDWEELFKKFNNRASYSSLLKTWQKLKSRVPNFMEKDFEDNVLYLYRVYKEECLLSDDVT